MPSTPADAKGLIAAAIRDPDPVVVLEPKALYRASTEPIPDGEHVVELGRAVVARHGTDATLVAYGAMLKVATAAAERLAADGKAEVEVLDLRTLTPLDEDAMLDSVAKTGRAVIVHEAPRTAGFGAEVAALLAERGSWLSARRCGGSPASTSPIPTGRSRTTTSRSRSGRPGARGGPALLSDPH